jgi:hypothetical protein
MVTEEDLFDVALLDVAPPGMGQALGRLHAL